MNTVMAVALRTNDPAKVLEPLAEDFKKMAEAADRYNAIPDDTLDTLEEVILLLEPLKVGWGNISEVIDKLSTLRTSIQKAITLE